VVKFKDFLERKDQDIKTQDLPWSSPRHYYDLWITQLLGPQFKFNV